MVVTGGYYNSYKETIIFEMAVSTTGLFSRALLSRHRHPQMGRGREEGE
jgi:hypothetical protein